jgi:hypothetical protein
VKELTLPPGVRVGIGEASLVGPGPEDAECGKGAIVPLGIAVLGEFVKDAAVG